MTAERQYCRTCGHEISHEMIRRGRETRPSLWAVHVSTGKVPCPPATGCRIGGAVHILSDGSACQDPRHSGRGGGEEPSLTPPKGSTTTTTTIIVDTPPLPSSPPMAPVGAEVSPHTTLPAPLPSPPRAAPDSRAVPVSVPPEDDEGDDDDDWLYSFL